MTQETAKRSQKVLLLVTKATFGGAQRYVYDLATNLPQEFEVTVGYGLRGKLSDDLERAKVRTVQIPSLSRDVAILSDIKSFFEILAIIRQTRPDVLHVNSSKAAGIGALAGRIMRVKRIIFTAHGWPHKEPRGSVARAAILTISWLTALLSHVVIVVSSDDELIGKRMPFISKKIRHIPIGRAPHRLYTRETSWIFFRGLAPKLRANKSAYRIVSIGELTRNKGHRFAIEALALLKKRAVSCSDTHIGDGEEYESLMRLAEQRGVSERVAFVGFLPNAADYLNAFDAFVLPSLKEGMPYALLEAGDAQLPIVTTTAVSAMADTYERMSIVPAASAEDLADAIEETLRQPHRAEPYREESRYPLHEMVTRTAEAYR